MRLRASFKMKKYLPSYPLGSGVISAMLKWPQRIFLGLSLLLLTGVGYVRLDEYTQRRYTRSLRVAGVGVASAVAAGLWWVFIQSPG